LRWMRGPGWSARTLTVAVSGAEDCACTVLMPAQVATAATASALRMILFNALPPVFKKSRAPACLLCIEAHIRGRPSQRRSLPPAGCGEGRDGGASAPQECIGHQAQRCKADIDAPLVHHLREPCIEAGVLAIVPLH